MTKTKENRLPGGHPTDGKGSQGQNVISRKKYTTPYAENQQVLRRAVKIAARVLNAAGLCRYEDAAKCRRVWPPDEKTCDKCIERWLLAKARKELRNA